MIKHLTTWPNNPHRNPLLPVKRIFGYFLQPKKVTRISQRSWRRNAFDLKLRPKPRTNNQIAGRSEFEVEIDIKVTGMQCHPIPTPLFPLPLSDV